jgi:hypothetical protein
MPANLVERCIAARNDGADFPTVWLTVLRLDPLVRGVPTQTTDDGRVQLEIRLLTGQRFIFDSEANGYSLWPFPPR